MSLNDAPTRQTARPAALIAAATCALLASAPAQAIVGGTATNAFAAVGPTQGVQVTPDWVFTAQHTALNTGDAYGNGYGARIVAQRYDAPGSGTFPANDFSLLRLLPAVTAAPFLPVAGSAVPNGTFAAQPVTIASGANQSPRGYGFTTIDESAVLADPDDAGPLQPVIVNWLISHDIGLYVQGGDSAGGLFAGHVFDSSWLLGITSALLTGAQDQVLGSAFVQPAAYRSWIDSTMAADGADTQAVLWLGAAVPEPATWALWAAGAALLASRRRA